MNEWDKSPEQEQALITRCLRGEKDAWEDFVRSYTRLVYFIINKLDQARAARLSREEIADLHNDVFLLLMEKKLSQYEGRDGCRLASWVRLVTVSTTLNTLRSRQVRMRHQAEVPGGGDEDRPLEQDHPDPSMGPEEEVRTRAAARHLEGVIKTLPPRERLYLALRYEKDLSPPEIARILKISTGALYTLGNRVRGKIKTALENP